MEMDMHSVHTEYRDQVAIVALDREITNALDLQLIEQLAEALRDLERDPNAHAIVLTSSNEKFFSIGFDIPHLFGLTKEEFRRFYQAFNRISLQLYTFPKPTVAAITGHAIAGGCILALCCDYRLIAEGRKLMGLNEVKLGVPVPYPADCILRSLVGVRYAREIVDVGEFYQPTELLQMGLVDQVLPLERVLPGAVERAALLGALPREASVLIKRSRVEPVEEQIAARLEEKERLFIERWYAADTRERLKAAMEKF
jgi:enoyl-CoA hydratase/carnithine racemase